jgi:hypothetical protein
MERNHNIQISTARLWMEAACVIGEYFVKWDSADVNVVLW